MHPGLFFAQIESASKLIDHAAGQSVVWFLCAAVGVLGYAVYRMDKNRSDQHEDTKARLETVLQEHIAYLKDNSAKLTGVVQENTSVMREFAEAVNAVKHLFQK